MKKTVFVGLSGGVDSSVAAARLIKQGYKVVGVFIKVWHPDFLECNWEEERVDAMRVAAHLNIPFLTCDGEAAYRDNVAKYFIEEYQAGRTPNPDVLCNKEVKFGVFLDFAKAHGADFVATGHYAQVKHFADHSELYRGLDTNKDQSYFLWSLNAEQLSQALFPIGDTTKDQIRLEAEALKLPTATKKDSQGVCFLGHVDIPEFISHYTKLEKGKVLDNKGMEIGEHRGALVYTLGQRHGFNISKAELVGTPHYVVAKNIEDNTITVATNPPLYEENDQIILTNIIAHETLPKIISIQTRYRQTPYEAEVIKQNEEEIIILPLQKSERAASGQSCVLYLGDRVLGGGMIV